VTWRLRVSASAERGLGRLPEKAGSAVVEFLTGPLLKEPRRVRKPLSRELTGYLAARRGPYRIVYRVDEVDLLVEVVRIDHRSRVYRRR
jgi:mRNA-degrading endonuclease RelE of RelBE toxin-antitoxin system